MDHQEITIGAATYEIQRIYQGDRPAKELLADRLVQNIPVPRPVDVGPAEAV